MNKTKKMNQIFKVFVFLFWFFCSSIYFTPAGAENITIRFDERKMSVDIDGAILNDIFETIAAQREFSVKGDKSILNSEVSISFTDLSFEDGLKKILGKINYILVFDKNKEPSGVIIVDGGGAQMSAGKATPEKEKTEVASTDEKDIKPKNTGKKSHGPTPISDMTPPTEEEMASMEVIKDAPTPGGPVKVSEEEMENLKIVKSNTPPGGAVKATPEELESMNPGSDAQSMPEPGVNNE
jgi:hypothetical protein